MSVLVEICCGSVEDVLRAEEGGAHRVELCSALPLGGLTPSAATVAEAKRQTKLPLMVMIRPRSGGFCYSEVEFATMEREIELATSLGADGLVFGVLNPDGGVDIERTRKLVKRAGALTTVFHRAFDVVSEPTVALEQLIDLGLTRVLTSGQKRSSMEGAMLIQSLVVQARGRIEILPGGGVRLENAAELIALTGCHQLHLTAHRRTLDTSTYSNRNISFGAAELPDDDCVDVIDLAKVSDIVKLAARL